MTHTCATSLPDQSISRLIIPDQKLGRSNNVAERADVFKFQFLYFLQGVRSVTAITSFVDGGEAKKVEPEKMQCCSMSGLLSAQEVIHAGTAISHNAPALQWRIFSTN